MDSASLDRMNDLGLICIGFCRLRMKVTSVAFNGYRK